MADAAALELALVYTTSPQHYRSSHTPRTDSTTPTSFTMDQQPPLLRIPPEIRVQIYDHLNIIWDHPLSIYSTEEPPAIGQTCRLLREETLDAFYSRNRFIVSHTMCLADTLKGIDDTNIARISRLQFVRLGCRYQELVTVAQHVDVDFLREAPWVRVRGGPVEVVRDREMPPILEVVKKQRLQFEGQGYERFAGLSDLTIRRLLVPKLMAKALDAWTWAGGEQVGVQMSKQVLTGIIETWLWASHILICPESRPEECKKCSAVLSRWSS